LKLGLTGSTKSMVLTSIGSHAESVNLQPKQIFFPPNFIISQLNVYEMIMLARKKGFWIIFALFILLFSINFDICSVAAETGENIWTLDRIFVGEGGEYVVPE
jgi:hypothetical protein